MRRLLLCLLFVFAATFAVADRATTGLLYVGVKTKIVEIAVDANGKLNKRAEFEFSGGYRAMQIVSPPGSPVIYVEGYRDDGTKTPWHLFTLRLKSDGMIDRVIQGPMSCDFGYLTLRPNGRYLYNVFQDGQAVRYLIRKDGSIDFARAYPNIRNTSSGESNITWSPDARFVYVATNDHMLELQLGNTGIAKYRATDGVLKPVPGAFNSDFNNLGASKILISRDGRSALLFCANEKMIRYRRNPKTGLLKQIGQISYARSEMQVLDAIQTRPGRIYALSFSELLDMGTVEKPLAGARLFSEVPWMRSILPGQDCVFGLVFDNANDKATKASIVRIPFDGGAVSSFELEDFAWGAGFRPMAST